ncbi:DUF2785 domain-containing protein [Heyndrickxia sp. MSNUG]|uniref:DUF2785 domain-containing protein n=1 Tax=Heyndrickxia sp. MSNUG TaxID=3136677 RepID=UPI003C2AE22B
MENTALLLKEELKDLDFKQPETIKNKDLNQLIQQMADHIGSTDSELRDKLIYTSFYYLIKQDYLNERQLTHLLETCLDENHLFLSIGSTNDDSVFTRAFSSLIVALILGKDSSERFLSDALVLHAIESSLLYLNKEKDTRGFVEGKGWAHSIAHGADLLDEAIKHPLFEMDLADDCLKTIIGCILKEAAYTDREDERLIYAVEALLDKGMDESVLEKWITSLPDHLSEMQNPNGFSLSIFRKKTNSSNFLKALYFRLMFKNEGVSTRKRIVEILEMWHQN